MYKVGYTSYKLVIDKLRAVGDFEIRTTQVYIKKIIAATAAC